MDFTYYLMMGDVRVNIHRNVALTLIESGSTVVYDECDCLIYA